MRNHIVRAMVVACLLGGATLAYSLSAGPVASRTGAPAIANKPVEPLCVVCHTGAEVNTPEGLLEILDVPAQYTPGNVYPIRVRLSYAHDPGDSVAPYKWGFQLTAVLASTGDSAGTLVPRQGSGLWIQKQTSPSSVYKNRRYIEHGLTAASTHVGEVGPVEWVFDWIAPPSDSGTALFYAGGNAANGDECSGCGGDFIFTAAETSLAGGGTSDVPTLPPLTFNTELDPPYPNPFNNCVDLGFSVRRDGTADVSIFDLNGRLVRNVFHGWRTAGPWVATWDGKRADGTRAPNGVYLVRVRGAGDHKPASAKIILAR